MKQLIFTLSCITLSLTMSLPSARAQDRAPLLKLVSGSFELVPFTEIREFQTDIHSWPSHGDRAYGIVRFGKYPTNEQWLQLESAGIKKLEFLNNRSFVLSIKNGADITELLSYEINAFASYDVAFKTKIDIEKSPIRARAEKGNIILNVHPFSDIPVSSILSELISLGGEMVELETDINYAVISINQESAQKILGLPFVQFIDWKYDAGYPENYTSRTMHRTNFLAPESTNNIGYNGEGINVMLQDDGSIGEHIDHEGRILEQFWQASTGDHGDHVGGTINGAGNLNPYHEGQAKGSNLYVYKAAPQYQGFDSIATHYYTKNVVITSTSYSNGCNAGYTALARTMDEQVFDLEHLVHVFSAGNSGTSNCGYGAGSTWGNITGGHKVGKNVITVANLNENDILATSSSRGPAFDGRIKPDISAKGTSVTSTQEDNTYGVKSGTSMSCPGVSGTLAVLYSAYDGEQGELPPSGLMKAIVLNTADDLGNVGPDFKYGWGRINARKAYEVISNSNFTTGSLSDGDSTQFTLIVPTGSSKARFMLYWTDPEASTSASTSLVNDLDLVIIDPSNNENLPYVLDHTPSTTTLNYPAVPDQDHLNNMEQVEFFAPASGNYLVKVKGYDVPSGPQEFFLVHWFEPEEFVLTYPIGGESMVPFSTEKIRWDSYSDTGDVFIQYSSDGGSTWFVISASTPASQGYYDWTVPNIATGNVQLRITYASQVSTSNDFSIIRTPSNLQIEYSCPDSIGLSWNTAANATGYEVYRLGNKYMDSIGVSSINEFVDYTANPLSDKLWYSVASTGPNDAIGKRLVAVKMQPGIFNCPIAHDAGIENVSPDQGSLFSCHGDSIEFSFVIKNFGNNTITSLDADLISSTGQTISESFVINVGAGSTLELTFTELLAVNSSLNLVTLSIDAPNDGNGFNDSLQTTYYFQSSPTISPIWSEDFETFSTCGIESDCGSTVCSLSNGWVNEETYVVDDSDWRTNSGNTPSDFTGPSADHTTGNTSGKYLYMEASGGCTNLESVLLSPCIDLVAAVNPTLLFWYNMNGADMGTLEVDVFDGSTWTNGVFSISGNQGSSWDLAEVSLSQFGGYVVNLRFRAITGNDYRSDIAIDDIMIAHPPIANFEFGVQNDGLTVDFVDLSLYGDTMSFDLGEGTVMTSVPASFTYTNQQVYAVTQIVTNPVGSDTLLKLITTLGEEEITQTGLVVTPVPANDVVTISFRSEIETVSLFTSDGRLVLTHRNVKAKKQTIDLKDVQPGVYFLLVNGHISRPISIVK
jgi:hypothetical protein